MGVFKYSFYYFIFRIRIPFWKLFTCFYALLNMLAYKKDLKSTFNTVFVLVCVQVTVYDISRERYITFSRLLRSWNHCNLT